MSADLFTPFEELAAQLLPHIDAGDGSHDIAHLARVWRNMWRIHAAEGGSAEVLAAACILHDCVAIEKNDPRRAQASRLAAERAREALTGLGWGDPAPVCHAIEAHSFSAGIAPQTLEARILQDADRLDAIGWIGAARCFYIAGRMGSALYHVDDPRGAGRALDDAAYALDHFETKLLRLADGFQTEAGREMARARHARLLRLRDEMLDEIGG